MPCQAASESIFSPTLSHPPPPSSSRPLRPFGPSYWNPRPTAPRRRSASSCLTEPLFVAIYEVRCVCGIRSFAFVYISQVHARVHLLAASSPSTPQTLTMKVFSLVFFAAILSVAHGALHTDPRRLARQDSNNGIHLAVSPACGSLSGNTADVNAGIDLKRVKTIVAFGVSTSPRLADLAQSRLGLTLPLG